MFAPAAGGTLNATLFVPGHTVNVPLIAPRTGVPLATLMQRVGPEYPHGSCAATQIVPFTNPAGKLAVTDVPVPVKVIPLVPVHT